MLVWVPLPVCQMTSGNWSSSAPETICCAAFSMPATIVASRPCFAFTRAAACFTIACAWTMPIGIRSVAPKGKFSMLRWVWAPQ